MADGVTITPGAGVSIASDDIGGIQYQRVKITQGVDGSATDVSSTNPLPITADTLPLPTGAASENTLVEVRNALTDDIPELPPQPIVATSPFTYIKKTSSTATTTTIIAAPGPGLTARCYRYRLQVAAANVIELKDGAANSWAHHDFGAAGTYEGQFWQWPYNGATPENSSLTMVTSTTGAVVAEFWVASV